jgi:hypothetical protein
MPIVFFGEEGPDVRHRRRDVPRLALTPTSSACPTATPPCRARPSPAASTCRSAKLLALGGTYAEMFTLQAAAYAPS